jgi:cell division protein ZapA (FtsZ GTPase activity inhibitor)
VWRFELLRRPAFWLPAAMMLVFCVPWFVLTRGMSHPSPTTSNFMMIAVRLYGSTLIGLGGGLLLALAAAGFIGRVVLPWRSGQVDTLCAVQGAGLISVLGFHCLVNCGLEARYLLVAAPSLMVLAAAGLDWCVRRLVAQAQVIGPAKLAMMVALLVSIHLLAERPRASGVRGLATVADTLTTGAVSPKGGLMISSDPVGEGAFISQIAIREQRPGRRILRADKLLADSNWDARVYRNRFETPAQVMEQLVAAKVKVLVVDSSIPRRNRLPYHRQIEQVIGGFPERWQEVGAYPATRDGKYVANALKVYRLLK